MEASTEKKNNLKILITKDKKNIRSVKALFTLFETPEVSQKVFQI